jgi:hypothetical protein
LAREYRHWCVLGDLFVSAELPGKDGPVMVKSGLQVLRDASEEKSSTPGARARRAATCGPAKKTSILNIDLISMAVNDRPYARRIEASTMW